MICRNCDNHVMHKVDAADDKSPTFWCPRCGSLQWKLPTGSAKKHGGCTPKLVPMVIEFLSKLRETVGDSADDLHDLADHLGVTDAVTPPGAN